jgi:hypothetical protein
VSSPGGGGLVTPGFVLRTRGTTETSEAAADFFRRFVTLSTCLAEGVPAPWAHASWPLEPGERASAASAAGCDAERAASIQSWLTRRLQDGDVHWPDLFPNMEAAREFTCLLPRLPAGLMLLGIGVRARDAARFGEETGSSAACRDLRPMPKGGTWLGWEPATVFGGPTGHSWRCNRVDEAARRAMHVLPNADGLIDSEDIAVRVVDKCNAGDLPAEPEPWFALGVMRFPLEA